MREGPRTDLPRADTLLGGVVTALADLPRVTWSPHPGSQSLFVACPVHECLYEGTRGPGKTNALLIDYCQHVGQGFGSAWRGILFRQSFPALADVVAKSKEWIPRVFPDAKFNESNHVWRFPDGEELLLRYMDNPKDYWSYHGHEYPWIGWDELTNWPSLACYDVMKSCNRSSRVGLPRKYRASANPHGPGHHAVKARFIDVAPRGVAFSDEYGTRVTLHGHYRENAALMLADPGYADTLRAATADNPDQQAAWLDGSWDVVAGTFFGSAWDARVHVLPPFAIPASWPIDRAFDWGSSKPFAVQWWAESDGSQVRVGTTDTLTPVYRTFPRGTLFSVGEWYGMAANRPNVGLYMDGRTIAAGIREREAELFPGRYIHPGPADSSIYDVQDGHCIADSFSAGLVEFVKANKGPGSRKNGWELMRERLTAGKAHPVEIPAMFVFDTCRHLIRTLPAAPRSESKPDDIDTDSEDHALDAARYRCLAGERDGIEVSTF